MMTQEIYFTADLKRVYEAASPEGQEYIEYAVDYYVTELKKGLHAFGESSVAFTMMHEVDSALAKHPAPNVKCKKGCAFCCHINVDMTLAEAQVIVQYCRDNNIEIDEKLLKVQEPLTIKQRNVHPQNRCVFLADDNSCKIYEVRPLACRKHLVVSKPKFCDVSRGSKEIQYVANADAEILMSAFFTLKLRFGNMSTTILKAMQEQ